MSPCVLGWRNERIRGFLPRSLTLFYGDTSAANKLSIGDRWGLSRHAKATWFGASVAERSTNRQTAVSQHFCCGGNESASVTVRYSLILSAFRRIYILMSVCQDLKYHCRGMMCDTLSPQELCLLLFSLVRA